MKRLAFRALFVAPLLVAGAAANGQAQDAVSTPAPAQRPATDAADARFSMLSVDGGLMKLDTRNGQLSFCSARAGSAESWTCRLVPEERAAYEDEISRLNARIAALQQAGNIPPGVPDIIKPAPPAATPPLAGRSPGAGTSQDADRNAGTSSDTAKAPDAGDPTEQGAVRRQIDQAMDTAEYVFRRFMDMVSRMKGEGEKL